jgi:hypothetical protein
MVKKCIGTKINPKGLRLPPVLIYNDMMFCILSPDPAILDREKSVIVGKSEETNFSMKKKKKQISANSESSRHKIKAEAEFKIQSKMLEPSFKIRSD